MADRVQRPALGRTLQELKRDTASFSRVAEALDDAVSELSADGISGDLRDSVAKFQHGFVTLASSLFAIVRKAERVLALAELGGSATYGSESAPAPTNSWQASVEESREGAVSVLAAAMIKTSGGDLTRPEELVPALHAAENVVDAIADHVLARQRFELSAVLLAAGAQ